MATKRNNDTYHFAHWSEEEDKFLIGRLNIQNIEKFP
jgi:hypothetical protein